jgi:hypothetical protein
MFCPPEQFIALHMPSHIKGLIAPSLSHMCALKGRSAQTSAILDFTKHGKKTNKQTNKQTKELRGP